MVAGAQVAVGSVQRLGRRDWARASAVGREGRSAAVLADEGRGRAPTPSTGVEPGN